MSTSFLKYINIMIFYDHALLGNLKSPTKGNIFSYPAYFEQVILWHPKGQHNHQCAAETAKYGGKQKIIFGCPCCWHWDMRQPASQSWPHHHRFLAESQTQADSVHNLDAGLPILSWEAWASSALAAWEPLIHDSFSQDVTVKKKTPREIRVGEANVIIKGSW